MFSFNDSGNPWEFGIYLHSPNIKSTKCWEVNVSYFGSTSQPAILTTKNDITRLLNLDPSPMGWGKVPTWIKIRKWMDTWSITMVMVFVPKGSGSWICFLFVDFFIRDSTMGFNHPVSPLFGENMFFSSKHQRSKSKGILGLFSFHSWLFFQGRWSLANYIHHWMIL